MKTVSDSGEFPLPTRAIVRVQSVRIHNLDRATSIGGTIGQCVDRFLRESVNEGCYPNRVSIDLNPKEDNPADMD